MSDNFRVVECLHTPSSLFAIYDYTKLAYLAGHYLCIRQVVNSDARPTFIPLQGSHSINRYFGLAAFPNCLVLAEQSNSKDIIIHYYQQEENHLRYISELSRRSDPDTPVTMQMYNSNRQIYIVVRRELDLEVVVIDIATKMFIGRVFLNGDAVQFRVKIVEHLELFSVALRDAGQVVELEVIASKPEEQGVKVVEKGRWEMGATDAIHCWAKDELILYHSDSIFVYLQGKLIQTIPGIKNTKIIETTISGFLVATTNRMLFFKKSNNSFEVISQFQLAQAPFERVILSPQEDMLAFYSKKHEAIYYASNFDGQESQQRKNRLTLESIEHESKKIKTYNSPQSLFVITSDNSINIYSPITFHCYISVKIDSHEVSKINESQKRLLRSNTMMPQRILFKAEQGEVVQTVGIHPVVSVIGVAFKNAVRVYQVLYNELKVVKQILISHCREIGFNRSGSIMYAKVSGKQGSKIYLYNTLANYDFMEVLSSNRPIDALRFSHLDHIVYGIHQNGYYYWSLESLFKQRNENTTQIPFSIKGGEIYLNQLLLWGENDILLIDQAGGRQSIKLARPISNLLVQQGNLILSTPNGDLFRCKGINLVNTQLSAQSFRIFEQAQLFTVRANNVVLCLSKQGNILCVEWGSEQKNSHQVIAIQRRRIVKYQEQYQTYEDQMCELEEQMALKLQQLQQQFSRREKEQREHFIMELTDREDRYLAMRGEKLKLEQSMEENLHAHEQETLQQVKELEKMYERKIALTTNKLLTSEEIGFRNQLLARQNLQSLEVKHFQDIQHIRGEYGRDLTRQLQAGDKKDELFAIKRQYETRLSELQQENENLLKRFQSMTENSIVNLKKNVVNLQLKYSEQVSQKVNLQKQFEDKLIEFEVLKTKNEYLQGRLNEQVRRGQQLSREYTRVQALTVQKDESIACLEKRVGQLEKSNEIFKYRIIEMKNVSDPKEEEILKLKDNMIELQEEYQKITKKAHDYQQNITLLKKELTQTKNQLNTSLQKERKIDKSYGTVIDKIRQATKAPIQEIRKMLIKVLDQFDHPVQGKQLEEKRSNSPLGQLNRVREHLEICLMEVVETGKKNEKHKNVQISRKNRENSELLRQINDLRVRVRQLESTLKDRQLQLQELGRDGKQSSFKLGRGYDRVSTNFDSESREMVKNRTKESFFEKSMFKGYWREKRLKTEQGSRKKSAHSLMKQETNNLYIESKGEEVEELRRLLDQKQTIIKQLINKIHKLS